MMTAPPPLGPEARALLDAARGATGPDAAALARMKAGIGTKVATSAGSAMLGAKLGIVAALAGAIILGAVALHTWRSDADRAHAIDASLPMASPVEVVAPPSVETVVPDHPPATRDEPSRPVVTSSDRPARTGRRPVDLTREVELIDTAMAALRRGDTTTALAAVRLHARETNGAGQLAEDAAAIAIEAHCLAGTGDRDALLTAFDRTWPRSSQRARIADACAR